MALYIVATNNVELNGSSRAGTDNPNLSSLRDDQNGCGKFRDYLYTHLMNDLISFGHHLSHQ